MAVTWVRSISGEPESRNPMTGIAGCCARAATGHAAAPQSRELAHGSR